MCPVSSSDSQHIIIRGRQIKEGRICSSFVAACVSRGWSFSKWMPQNDRSSPLLEGGGGQKGVRVVVESFIWMYGTPRSK